MNDKKVNKPAVSKPVNSNEKNAQDNSADNNSELKHDSETKGSAKKPKPTRSASFDAEFEKVVKKNERRPGRGLSWFAILLSLVSLGGAGYVFYQTEVMGKQRQSTLSQNVSDIGGKVERLDTSISTLQESQSQMLFKSDLSKSANEIQANLDKQLKPLHESQKVLGGAFSKIKNDLAIGTDKFLLDEVSQLLRLANTKVLFESNTESAIAALKYADDQLKALSDPRYSGVRGKINEEIATLRTVKLVDVEGLSGQLRGIAAQVSNLPLANEPQEKRVEIVAPPSSEDMTWRTELKKVWRDLLSSVQVRRIDQPAKPLLVPEQRYFLIQNLKLTLTKAELALLNGENSIFVTSIQDATTWLRDYFEVSDERVTKVIAQLDDIAKQNTKSEIPAITGSYQALQSLRGS